MKKIVALGAVLSVMVGQAWVTPTLAAAKKTPSSPTPESNLFSAPRAVKTFGSVTVEGHKIAYEAVAGTIIVHPAGWDDAAKHAKGKPALGTADGPPVAAMFYVAYFKRGVKARNRPVTFLYNGGPGSSTVWLHMGAFGPVRVVTSNDTHTPPAPYGMVNNTYSLLDASDLVFIDAPGTGFGRVEGKGKGKAFYGVDPDANAFASFVMQFLSKYDRWNSPKYLFGESYGTPRSAVLINQLEQQHSIDFNGVILLSQILNFDLMSDLTESNPGNGLPYEVELPTFAATAWYHHLLPSNPPALKPLLKEVEQFAMGEYADALAQGADLSSQERDAVAQKLHEYTGLPLAYIEKANLRVTGPEFEKTLQGNEDLTTGRLDTRFSGPTLDPLSKEAEYDPQAAAISSAYVSAFNDYVRSDLHFGMGEHYKPVINVWTTWDFRHRPPGADRLLPLAVNVMPDLAAALKYDPDLKIMLNGGYFDLATPFYEGIYEMHHLQIPQSLQSNIQYHYYESGHMVYANLPSLKQLHDNVAAFIRKTDNVAGG